MKSLLKKCDKAELVLLINRVVAVLDEYPPSIPGLLSNTVTTMSRAKSYASDAKKWIEYLEET